MHTINSQTRQLEQVRNAGPAVADPDLDSKLGEPMLDEGDHERFAHYVLKDKLLPSAVEGTPVVALCGKVWVPNRDPERFPVCPECKDIHKGLPDGKPEDPGES